VENLGVNRQFWQDKSVLLTGHTGFKGSWISLWLQTLNANVRGYALAPATDPSLFDVADVASNMSSVLGDVRDMGHLRSCIEEFQPEVVIHMAAQSLVRPSYADPIETYSTNVMGTVNLLEAVRHCRSIKVVIIVTSDKCYENREWSRGYSENDAMGGFDPYSSSKGCVELVTAAYRNSYFSDVTGSSHIPAVASVRAGNVIGGGDWAADRLVPDAVKAFIDKHPVLLRNPNAVRPWQHVLDPLAGYLALAEQMWNQGKQFAEAWNFGPEERDVRPVSWVVERLAELWGKNVTWQAAEGGRYHEAHNLKLDCSKAKTRLGWRPRLPLETALEWTADWYRAHLEGQNMRRFTQVQIQRYAEGRVCR
jgi:CDP-glucose 4,6-dehydratase